MLKKTKRLNRKSIEELFSSGSFVSSSNISLKYLIKKNVSQEKKISFVVPKNVLKSAVSRNLLRRRGYAVVEKNLSLLPDGFWGMFIFGKKSFSVFGNKKKKDNNSIKNLDFEINALLQKVKKF